MFKPVSFMQQSTRFALLYLIAAGFFAGGCLTAERSFTRLAPGIWRGVLVLEPLSMPPMKKDSVMMIHDQFKDGELPFNFEVVYLDEEKFYVELHNGRERIRCDSIRYGRDRTRARDTVNIYFPEYQTYIHADIRGGVMQGEWIVPTKVNYRVPFYAKSGQAHRFTTLREPPTGDLTGQWAALFGIDKPEETPEKAIGEFVQDGNHLEGTFRTETGDYRFLEGTVQGRKFWLSTFDGTHAYLFSGSFGQQDTLLGEFRSGKHYRTLWKGWKDAGFQLGNPDSLTTVLHNGGTIAFQKKTPDGRELVFPGPDFGDKIKIFTVMGTWCPNCRDEQLFLKEYLEKHPEAARDLAIVGFAFERHQDAAQANAQLRTYREKLGIPFDLVYAGKADKAEAERVFPALNHIMAFPTMIILDRDNQVRRVHTGFDGPATSKYEAFREHFEALIDELRSEN